MSRPVRLPSAHTIGFALVVLLFIAIALSSALR